MFPPDMAGGTMVPQFIMHHDANLLGPSWEDFDAKPVSRDKPARRLPAGKNPRSSTTDWQATIRNAAAAETGRSRSRKPGPGMM